VHCSLYSRFLGQVNCTLYFTAGCCQVSSRALYTVLYSRSLVGMQKGVCSQFCKASGWLVNSRGLVHGSVQQVASWETEVGLYTVLYSQWLAG